MLYLYLDIEVYFCLPALGRFFCALKKKTLNKVFFIWILQSDYLDSRKSLVQTENAD